MSTGLRCARHLSGNAGSAPVAVAQLSGSTQRPSGSTQWRLCAGAGGGHSAATRHPRAAAAGAHMRGAPAACSAAACPGLHGAAPGCSATARVPHYLPWPARRCSATARVPHYLPWPARRCSATARVPHYLPWPGLHHLQGPGDALRLLALSAPEGQDISFLAECATRVGTFPVVYLYNYELIQYKIRLIWGKT